MGCAAHFTYVALLMVYINFIYIQNNVDNKKFFEYLILVGVVYPAWFETYQLFSGGIRDYFSDLGNYSDIIYIWGSVTNVILQN